VAFSFSSFKNVLAMASGSLDKTAWNVLGLDGGDGLQLYRLAAKRLNKQSQTAENCGSTARRLSVALKTHSVQNKLIQNLTKIFEHGLISWLTDLS
jgi:hypothetical protein